MPTWNTASDWDSATAEDGVVHESVSNTDHDDASILKQGYEIATPYLSSSLVRYWPFQEDSGSTAYDFSGSNDDGTISGATVNQAGLLGTTAYDFDGVDDEITGMSDSGIPFTATFWAYSRDIGTQRTVYAYAYDYPNGGFLIRYRNGNMQLYSANTASPVKTSATANTWQFWAITVDSGDNFEIYLNGSSVNTGSTSSGTLASGIVIGSEGGKNYFDGRLTDCRIYNTTLSSSEVQYLYDVVATQGSLTTDYKSG